MALGAEGRAGAGTSQEVRHGGEFLYLDVLAVLWGQEQFPQELIHEACEKVIRKQRKSTWTKSSCRALAHCSSSWPPATPAR